MFEESKQHIRILYKMELKLTSTCCDHCVQYALSMPSDAKFRNKCDDHTHDMICGRCELLKISFHELTHVIQSILLDAQQEYESQPNLQKREQLLIIEDRCIMVKKAFDLIIEYKNHLARAWHSDKTREDILNMLTPLDCLLVMDFSQKVLRSRAREKQVDYFAKAGMSLHISVAMTYRDGKLVTHSFVNVMQDNIQVKS